MRCGGSRGCLDLGQQWRVIVVRQRGHRRQRLVWLLGLRTVWHSVVVVLWLVVVLSVVGSGAVGLGSFAGGGSSVVGSGAVGVSNCDAGLLASLVRGCSAMCTAESESRERVQCDGHG